MSSLIVEVVKIERITPHPNADAMEIAHIKGWSVATKIGQFEKGQKAVYFPPDTVIPHTLSDRLGITKYLGELAKDVDGNRPEAGRIKVAKLRGFPSYGTIIKPDEDWEVGENVAEYYGASKWEPPMKANQGDAEKPHPAFHKYYDMENIRNFPDLFAEGEEVVVSEKIHGMNCRLSLLKETDDDGNAVWRWAAGSHDVRRKQFYTKQRRFDAVELAESPILEKPEVEVGQIIDTKNGRFWRVDELVVFEDPDPDDNRVLFRATEVTKTGDVVQVESEFWMYYTPELKALMKELAGCTVEGDPEGQPVCDGGKNVVVFGERFGSGVQDGYWYGMQNGQSSFRVFDITVERQYLDYPDKVAVLDRFEVPRVPVLYEGPFDFAKIEELATGPSTLAEGEGVDDSRKVGREGVVVVSRTEGTADSNHKFHERRQLKCINFDYLARKGGTEYH